MSSIIGTRGQDLGHSNLYGVSIKSFVQHIGERVKTRRTLSGPRLTYCGWDLLCLDPLWLGPLVSRPTVARTSCGLDLLWFGPPVARTSCGLDLQESQPQDVQGRHCHRRSEEVIATGGPREALSREVRGSHSHRRSRGSMVTGGPQGTQ